MCLLVFAWQPGSELTLALAGNRDEFHDRPAAPAEWWDDSIIGGKDLRAGGTWMAAGRDGRFAVVTNYREPLAEGRGPRSRGELVSNYLLGDEQPAGFARGVAARGDDYAGFNLLLGSPETLVYLSNRGRGPEKLDPGVYGLSNHLLDSPWPKLARTRARFETWLAGRVHDTEALFAMLADREAAPEEELPDTGVGPEFERLLSSPFIVSPHYGTRCATVILLSADRRMKFIERRFNAEGETTGESAFEFALEARQP